MSLENNKNKPDICDDRGFITINMTQEELMIAINPALTKKQKNKLIQNFSFLLSSQFIYFHFVNILHILLNTY